MKTKTKLLAEKYLYEAASRFFDELDTVEQLSEKVVQATLPDGRKIDVEDEDYETLADVAPRTAADEYLGDVDVDSDASDEEFRFGKNVRTAKFTGKKSKSDATAAHASRYGARAEAGKKIYNQLAGAIHEVVKEFAEEQIEKGRITFDDDTEEWVLADNDPRATKVLLTMLQTKVNNDVIRPAKQKLTKAEQDALVAAFSVDFTNPYFIKDQPAFKGTRKILIKTLKGLHLNNESLKHMFLNACDKVLTEMYAKRYGVKMNEAAKMFIFNDKIVD